MKDLPLPIKDKHRLAIMLSPGYAFIGLSQSGTPFKYYGFYPLFPVCGMIPACLSAIMVFTGDTLSKLLFISFALLCPELGIIREESKRIIKKCAGRDEIIHRTIDINDGQLNKILYMIHSSYGIRVFNIFSFSCIDFVQAIYTIVNKEGHFADGWEIDRDYFLTGAVTKYKRLFYHSLEKVTNVFTPGYNCLAEKDNNYDFSSSTIAQKLRL